MGFKVGNKVNIEVSGASHSEYIEVRISGLPKDRKVDLDEVRSFLKRRQGGNASYTTARKEADEPEIIEGIEDGRLTGQVVVARFVNANARSKDYKKMRSIPRPSHADYVAFAKYGRDIDMSGGGFFSGRMTLPVCFAGSLCMQMLKNRGIGIRAHILSVGDVYDDPFDPVEDKADDLADHVLSVVNKNAGDDMVSLMESVSSEGDSIGGCIECKVTNVPAGLGDPIYDSVESALSYAIFGIPAIKGIEFGEGFKVAGDRGSISNDPFVIKEGRIRCATNNSGGIQGGITNGMPIIFRVAVKPTPSIYKPQRSVDLDKMEECELVIEGRHDSCIVPRVVPCVEAMCALVLADLVMTEELKNDH